MDSGILLTLLLGAFLAYSFYGIVLAYHWARYGASMRLIVLSFGTYAITGGYLLFAALLAVLSN